MISSSSAPPEAKFCDEIAMQLFERGPIFSGEQRCGGIAA
jgi:hypothetical protein